MSIEEFEMRYRNAMDETLNELQTAVLLFAQVQNQITRIGSSLQTLSHSVEDFISQQKAE
ncbi:hypothetical protein [Iningainema tapete]|uniref:Uncharacterized protein n=1 Tax=Iningainema tapete BLCC-T55 TaxID=2748662 RepID=A0A8J6XB13_9CYAN|nr:hypothetical protein [Iningainema tapete]MBD2771234.1 hypothetical protein [Iningainema tapete BLCC-T55]